MTSLLRDLLGHREWADAEHARAAAALPAAADSVLRARWHHMIGVQRAFLGIIGGVTDPTPPPVDAFPTVASLSDYLRASLEQERAFVDGLEAAALEERVRIPHFGSPPLELTRGEVLAQSAMHSQHHRAQNATRLRELGATPPTTDLIVWYWLGRPAPRWVDPS